MNNEIPLRSNDIGADGIIIQDEDGNDDYIAEPQTVTDDAPSRYDEIEASHRLTDTGNAALFVTMWSHHVRWVKDMHEWYVYDGTRWRQNGIYDVQQMAKMTAVSLLEIARRADDNDERNRIIRHSTKSANIGGIKGLLEAAKSESSIWAEWAEFDTQTHLLNFLNGTYNLKTGTFSRHDPTDLISRVIPRVYDPTAEAPKWESMIIRAVDEDEETAHYLKVALGYALLGVNPEQMIFFHKGPGQCGKSKILEIAGRSIGPDYATSSDTSLISKGTDRHARVQYNLRGARFVDISETDAQMRLDEKQLKRLTGDSHLQVHELYNKSTLDVPITWTIFVATNDNPAVENMDSAMKRRIVVIPFGPSIPDSERIVDLDEQILTEEADGVLAWLVEGCRTYVQRSDSLKNLPRAVRQATDGYQRESDTVWEFLNDCCVIESGSRMKRGALHAAYLRYRGITRRDQATLGKNKFLERVEDILNGKLLIFFDSNGNPRDYLNLRVMEENETVPGDSVPISSINWARSLSAVR
jgi:putative DNA primase/helicase